MTTTQNAIADASNKIGYALRHISSGHFTGVRVAESFEIASRHRAKSITLGILSGATSDYAIERITGAEYMAETGRFF